MTIQIIIFILSLALVIKGALFSTKYATKLAESFGLSKYLVGFIIIAVISILPETLISINAAVGGEPSFGLGMLFGSNIADLTLIFALLVFLGRRELSIENKILKSQKVYPFLLLLPIVLGLDGYFSRLEGASLILSGMIFYYTVLKGDVGGGVFVNKKEKRSKNALLLLGGMVLLLVGAHFTVASATSLAQFLDINPILIGMLVVGLGTTIPELFFSLRSVQEKDDSLAAGDILGTVLADATIVVGVLALINPFSFPQRMIYVTGGFMVVAALILGRFMRSGKTLSRGEAILLCMFWLSFVLIEFALNK